MEEPYVSREDFVSEEEPRFGTTRRYVSDYGVRNDTDGEPVVVNIRCTTEKPSSTKRECTETIRAKPRGGQLREENRRNQCSAQCPARDGTYIMADIAQGHKDQRTPIEHHTRSRSDQNARRFQPHTEVMGQTVRDERVKQMPSNARPNLRMQVQDDEKQVDNVDNKASRLSVDALNIIVPSCSHSSRVHPWYR